jgi:hypothetical protein
MGILELIIVVLVVLWLLGYFGRGRLYARGPAVDTTGAGWASGNVVHALLVLALILIVLRLLHVL